jgi:hypothetical protein
MVPGTSFERSLSQMSPATGAAGYTGESQLSLAYMWASFEYDISSSKLAEAVLHAVCFCNDACCDQNLRDQVVVVARCVRAERG